MADPKEKKIEELMKGIESYLITARDVRDVNLEEVSLRIGGKILKLVKVSDDSLSVEAEIRSEYDRKYAAKLQSIAEHIRQKMNESMVHLSGMRDEFLRKEAALQDKLNRAVPMPDITMEYARRGLSCFKGGKPGEINFLVRKMYWPKTLDRNPFDAEFSRKLATQIYVMVTTSGSKITGVSTRKPIGLDVFPHYHQAKPDCWGQWRWNPDWRTLDDIIKTADDAEAVLENVNSGSVANREPEGLPSFETLSRRVIKTDKKDGMRRLIGDLDTAVEDDVFRTGVTSTRTTGDDIWQN